MTKYRMDNEGNLHPIVEGTEVSKMTDAALNRELTELQGYSVKPASANPNWYRRVDPKGREFGIPYKTEELAWDEFATPYCTDPAASMEVQAAAIAKRKTAYIEILSDIVRADEWEEGRLGYEGIAKILTATPRQRAEAAYLILREVTS